MKTSYFTFGQSHFHNINGTVFDKDVVVKITAEFPREVMFKVFGPKWSMEYSKPPDMSFFPKGIKTLPEVTL